MTYMLITIIYSIGAVLESTFGFAGNVLALSVLSFFIDIKELVPMVLLIGTVLSSAILISDRKSFSSKTLLTMIIPATPGIIIGSLLLGYVSSEVLMTIFSIFLILISLYSLKEYKIPPTLEKVLLFFSGFIHGIIGTGGPSAVSVMKNKLTKSELRTNFAAFFIFLNLLRGTQYVLQGTYTLNDIFKYWWLAFPVLIAVWIGQHIHAKISEKRFKQITSIILLIIGLYLLVS